MPIHTHSRQDFHSINENYLIFHTAGQDLALPATHIVEILPMIPLVTVPTMPPFIAGFVDWGDGGTALPILRLERVLRLPRPARVPSLHTPIIVVRNELDSAPLFGLLVEVADGFVSGTFDRGSVQDQSFNGCVPFLLNLPDRSEPVAVLSVERLLVAEEKERLDAFQQIMHEKMSDLRSQHGKKPVSGTP